MHIFEKLGGIAIMAGSLLLSSRSARGDGIAPATSATPPDMRFSASGG